MAKRKKKSATALFEVMSAGKSLELPAVHTRNAFQPPSWWVKWRRRRVLAIDAGERTPATGVAEIEPARVTVIDSQSVVDESTTPGKRFAFPIDFTTGVIIASGLVCLVGLTFLIGRKLSGAKPPTMAATEMKKQAPRPSVMDLPRRPDQTPVQPPSGDPLPPGNDPQADTIPQKRIINLNYVVIQSFPDEKLAREAADLLNKNGVGCTVVQSLARWTNRIQWYSIVGTKGFGPRYTGTAEYEAYLAKIGEVSAAFAGRSEWKEFKPQSYRWGADSEK